MALISFQQAVALAFGAYIDPADTTQNTKFDLVGTTATATASLNYVNKYGQTVFGRNPRKANEVDNTLRSLLHYLVTGQAGSATTFFFDTIPGSIDIDGFGYLLTTTSTAISDADLTGYDVVFTGFNSVEKQKDYRSGGDINQNNSVTKVERNYHRTGLAIWNKLKK